ncbi:MAG: hypothetical protein ACRDDL_06900 [Sarcina sp.]
MKELFKISNINFYKEDFQDQISDYEDIIDIICEFQDKLKLEEIECAELNDCCEKTKKNLFAEIIGVLTTEDDFLTLEEVRAERAIYENAILDPFGIQIYKCLECNKWMINILESE